MSISNLVVTFYLFLSLNTVLPAICFQTVGSLSQRIRDFYPYLTDTVSTFSGTPQISEFTTFCHMYCYISGLY